MGWSITAGSVAGTAVRIHVTFVLLLVWIFGVNYFSGGLPAAWAALVFVVLLFLCVLLHEFGHIFTARAFGVSTPDVILLPIGGVSRLERIPEKPSEEFLVAIAGPAVNVVIAVLLILFAGAKLGMQFLCSASPPRFSAGGSRISPVRAGVPSSRRAHAGADKASFWSFATIHGRSPRSVVPMSKPQRRLNGGVPDQKLWDH